MIRDSKFWLTMLVFQVLFGLAIFAATRAYYIRDTGSVSASSQAPRQSAQAWPDEQAVAAVTRMNTSVFGTSTLQDPVEMSRQADEFFADRQFDRAAEMYERLLAFDPNNAEVRNNLGLTLHYLGRSAEALRHLNEGVAANPDNQRIWLTLGFVNSQLGNTGDARVALTTATQIGNDESIRQSALKMLDALPPG